MNREDWRWYIVVDDNGNCDEIFNSQAGAEHWLKVHRTEFNLAGAVIPVKEVENDRLSPYAEAMEIAIRRQNDT